MARKFFYDMEFMEEPGFLELISIGVVGDAGEFYAGNAEADFSRANKWVRDNVFPKLPSVRYVDGTWIEFGSPEVNTVGGFWATREVIKKELLAFLKPTEKDPVEMWGYYSDYDHVLLCWLFGRMIDLPKGMPMFTRDVKQLAWHLGSPAEPAHLPGAEHNALEDARWVELYYESLQKVAFPGMVR